MSSRSRRLASLARSPASLISRNAAQLRPAGASFRQPARLAPRYASLERRQLIWPGTRFPQVSHEGQAQTWASSPSPTQQDQ